jgi:hypothetical protein
MLGACGAPFRNLPIDTKFIRLASQCFRGIAAAAALKQHADQGHPAIPIGGCVLPS